ncbi:MAG: phosphoribosyl-ATP diphosphatase, partial [Paludibacteraceae bacterium]|nr:phosphoribosyl-ATP diphosphatase [Paludibacteraceae bacterium]
DTLLIKVIPEGPVCHTGSDTCWNEINDASIDFLTYLQDLIEQRFVERPEGSYTTRLFNSGVNNIAEKMGSKAVSSAVEAANGTNEGLICESEDLLYHLLVLLTSKGLRIEDLANELKNRHKK